MQLLMSISWKKHLEARSLEGEKIEKKRKEKLLFSLVFTDLQAIGNLDCCQLFLLVGSTEEMSYKGDEILFLFLVLFFYHYDS